MRPYRSVVLGLAFGLMLISRAQEHAIYVSDAGNFSQPPWQILKFDADGLNGEVFISEQLAWPQDILFLDDVGEVLISNLNTGKITRYDAGDGTYLGDLAAGIAGPTRMKIGPDGSIYVLQWLGDGNVLRYDPDGTALGAFTTVGVSQAIGIDWDANGDLYVSSYDQHSVRRYDTQGNDLGLFIDQDLTGPTNIWFDDQGDLLVINYNGNSVKRFNSDGEYQGDFITGLAAAEGVAFTPDGNILIGNGQTSSVKMFDPAGQYLQDIVQSGELGLLRPNAVVLRSIVSGIHEGGYEESILLVPSIGRQFHLSRYMDDPLRSITLISLSGEIMKQWDPKSRWMSAEGLPTGLYMATAEFQDGQRISQRILIMDI